MSTLNTNAILQRMAEALPTHSSDDDSSDLASSYEAIALLIHAYLAALNFKLLGFDEEKPLAECGTLAPRLPASWNNGFGSLSFLYSHKQSAMRFVIRIDRMGGKVEVRGLAVGDEKIYRFERTVRDVVNSNNLPIRITVTNGQEDRNDLMEKLRKAFTSEKAISGLDVNCYTPKILDMLHDLKVNIIQKLIPKLQKEGYVEVAEAEATATSERRAQEARGSNPPFRPTYDPTNPRDPFPNPGPLPDLARPRPGAPAGDFPPPGFEDEYEINRPHGRGGLVMPGRSPFNIGHDDLNPPGLGPHDPLRGSFTPGGLPRPGGGSGMHPNFDDPLFTGEGGFGGAPGGFDPQAPPGARWDPTGPSGNPRSGGPGGRRGGPFGGGGGFGSFGGDII